MDGLQNLILPQSVRSWKRSSVVAISFHYVHVLAVVIPMSLICQTTQSVTVTAATNFSTNSFQSLDCCQSHISFHDLQQISRLKFSSNTEWNIVMEMLFTSVTAFVQVQNNISKAIHKWHPKSNKFISAWEGWIKIISLCEIWTKFGEAWKVGMATIIPVCVNRLVRCK